jgi:hypothetical protein
MHKNRVVLACFTLVLEEVEVMNQTHIAVVEAVVVEEEAVVMC